MKYREDSAILARYLEQKVPEVYETKHPELPFDNGSLLPQFPTLQPGAEFVVAETVQEYGEAYIMGGKSQDFPTMEIQVAEDSQPVVAIAASATYNHRELDAMAFAQRNGQLITNVRERRLFQMERAIAEKSHKLGAYGDAARGLNGFLTDPNIPVLDDATNIHDPATNPQDIINWFCSQFTAIVRESNMVEIPNLALVTYAFYRYISTTFRNTNSDMTVKDAIMAANPELRNILPLNELTSTQLEEQGVHASGNNKDRMVIYKLDPKNCFRYFEPMKIMPPEQNGMNHHVIGYKCVSGVLWEYPESARYIDYPKAL